MRATQDVELVEQSLEEPPHQLDRIDSSSQPESDIDPPQDATSVEDVPPNGGYGWVCTACVFMLNAHSWGINSVSNASLPFCLDAD
jgi:hypothetical protein